jgi:MarR family transcriptional regulator, organic hydroperoxide resistance regulator
VSRPELLPGGTDRDFRHLVHGLFGFAARHERIRAGHAKVIGLAGIDALWRNPGSFRAARTGRIPR